MKLKNKLKKLLVVTLTAGITVNSIPLSSYAATISQPASGLAVTVEESTIPELITSMEEGNSGEAGTGEPVMSETDGEASESGNGTEAEGSTGNDNKETDSSTEADSGSGNDNNTETDSETETDTTIETNTGTDSGTEADNGTENETETANETEAGTEADTETETDTETEIDTETETETESETETETEPETEEDETALLEEQLQALIQEAKEALNGITASEYVMALVYLCDSYEVKAEPSFDAQTVAVLKSGHTVFIKDVEVNTETGTVWYQASFVMDEKEYTGYISRDYLAYSNESLLSWEELYIEPVVQLCQKNITQADYALDSNAANSYSNDISQFPESYRAALQTLKNSHPNWTFVKFDTGLNWDEVVTNEMVGARSLVHKSAKDAWKREVYAQDNNWYYATEGAVRYCLDPRNGFTESRIFQFEQLTFNESYHSVNAIQGILNNTFMKGNVPQLSISYAQDFYNIGKNRKISPFHLASRVLQEQGVNGGSALISGTYTGYNNQYYGYYNYFNIGATSADPIQTGLKYAKEKGWNTPHKSLEGGAASIGNSYILQGQDTLYLQKFDVESQYNGLYYHQYMQNIQAPASEASTIRNLYNQAGALNGNFVFKVPTYNNMPASACPDPSLETIKLSSTAVSLKGGYDTTVTYSISGANASQSKVTWKVEDTSIIKAEQVSGKQAVKITALKAGTTNIKFTSSNGAVADCKVTVVKDTIVLSKQALSINAGMSDGSTPGETLEITYTINNPKSSVSGCKVDKPELLEVEVLSEEVDTANNTIKGTIRLKALTPGEVKLTLTSKYSGQAVCTVTVVRLPEQLKMEGPVTVSVGNSKHVNCEVLPEDTTNKNLKWSSSDEKIVIVNPSTGRITGVGTGTATLTATTEEKSLAGKELTATCEVTVVASVAYVEIAKEEAELVWKEEAAETFSMEGKVYLQQNMDGEPVLQEASGQQLYNIVYTSSDESIATVDANGLVTATGIGNTIITATVVDKDVSSGTKSARCKVSVVPEKKEEIIIPDYDYVRPQEIKLYRAGTDEPLTEDTFTLISGGSIELDYEILPENASVEEVFWESSKDAVVYASPVRQTTEGEEAAVSKNKGRVRILAGTRGNAVITVSTDIGVKKQLNFSVEAKENIKSVTLDHTNVVLYANGTDGGTMSSTICLTASPQSNAESGIVYQWSSTNEAVAEVDEQGKVTAKAPGVAVITVQDETGSGNYAQCTVTVERCLEEIKTNVQELWIQAGKKVTVKVLPSPADVTSSRLEWKSADESVAAVTDKGVVTAAKTADNGKTTTILITDKVTGMTKEIPLTITGTSCKRITLENEAGTSFPTAQTLYQNGNEAQQSFLVKPAGYDGSQSKIEKLAFYAVSSNEKIAAVESVQNMEGNYDGSFKVTAKGAGNATIKFYAADGSGKSTSVKVNVKLHPETVSVEKEALYLTAGASGKMSAKLYPSNAAEKGITWKFKDDKAVAGFNLDPQTGKVRVERGTITGTTAEFVAVTRDGGILSENTCAVTVIGAKVGKVKLDTSSVLMTGNNIEQIAPAWLETTVTPANADVLAARLEGISSNEEVAKVEPGVNEAGEYDGTFKITATGYGMTTITIQTLDRTKKAVCKVYVSSVEKGYKLSALRSNVSIQNYAADINSSSTLRIKDQFGNILDNSLFTFSSNRTDIAVVDEKGVVTPNKAYRADKNGKAVITAALAGDPYNRKVKFNVSVLAQEQAESVSITALGVLQNGTVKNLTNPESVSLKYPTEISFKAETFDAYGNPMEMKMKWTVSDSSVASIALDGETKYATLTIKKAGKFYLTCTAGDTLQKSRRIQINAVDAKPVMEQKKVTISKQAQSIVQENGEAWVYAEPVRIIENKDLPIQSICLKDIKKGNEEINASNFKVERAKQDNWNISVLEASLQSLTAGSYKAVLSIETAEMPEIGLIGQNGVITYEIPVTLSIADKKPKVSVKAVSINRQNKNEWESVLAITAPDEIEKVELPLAQGNQFDKIFEVRKDEESGDFLLKFKEDYKTVTGYSAKSITGKAEITVKGYKPVTVNVKVNTPLNQTTLTASAELSIDVKNGNTQKVAFYDKNAKQNLTKYKIQVLGTPRLEIVNSKGEDGLYRSNWDGTLILKAKAGESYTNKGIVMIALRITALDADGSDLWEVPVDTTISVRTYTEEPEIKLGNASMTLNRQAFGESAQTSIETDRDNVRIADDVEWQISRYDSKTKKYTEVKKSGQKAEDTTDDIVLSYNRQKGMLTAQMKENAKIGTGNYKYRITWIAEDYSQIRSDVTVNVVDRKVSAKITTKGKLDLLTRSNTDLQGTISLTNTTGKVKSITIMEQDKNGEYVRNSCFYSAWLTDNTFRIRLREVADTTTGKKTMPVKLVLDGGTVLYTNLSFTVSQSNPKITVPKTQTIYKSESKASAMYDMNEQIPSGYEISAIKTVSAPSGIGVTIKDGRISVSLADRGLKPGTYSIKVNLYFKGAQYVFGSNYGKAFQKTLKVTIKE